MVLALVGGVVCGVDETIDKRHERRKEMPEIHSVITRTKRTGEQEGLYVMPRDAEFVQFAARWWCVNADAFVRKTSKWKDWVPAYMEDKNGTWRDQQVRSVTRRMSKWASLDQYPLLVMRRAQGLPSGFLATQAGADLVGAPFDRYPAPRDMTRALHAWAACDIGMGLERLGLNVYSEREFAVGVTVEGHDVAGGKFVNALASSKSRNKDHGMRPDVAIAGTDGRFIMVEVERTPKATAAYRAKLLSYYSHERVAAVWYVTSNEIIARRLKRVHADLEHMMREMPVRVMRMEHGHHGFVYTRGPEAPTARIDLTSIGAI